MKSRWIEVQMPRGGKMRIRIHQSRRIYCKIVGAMQA